MFPDVHSACSAASVLRDQTAVDAVEMFDTASLRWVSWEIAPAVCPHQQDTHTGAARGLTNVLPAAIVAQKQPAGSPAPPYEAPWVGAAYDRSMRQCGLSAWHWPAHAPVPALLPAASNVNKSCSHVAVYVCRECAKDEGMVRLVPDIVDADDGAAGLLIECRGWDESCLKVLPIPILLCRPHVWIHAVFIELPHPCRHGALAVLLATLVLCCSCNFLLTDFAAMDRHVAHRMSLSKCMPASTS